MKRLAVVIGASGTIGTAITARLEARGDLELIGCRLTRDMSSAAGAGPVVGVNLANDDGIEPLRDAVKARRIEVLVSAAGTQPAVSGAGRVFGVDAELVRQELEVKVLGILRLLGALRDRLGPESKVIVIGGNLAFEPIANGGGVGVAEAALSNLFRQMSKASIGGDGPSFHVIAPGPVRSPRLDAVLAATGGDAEAAPLRVIEPEQVAWMVDVLVDGPSQAMTGGTLVMDGGMRMGLP